MKRLLIIPSVTLFCFLAGCSSPDTSGVSELPDADCEKLTSFPSNFEFNPWGVHEERREAITYIEEDAKEKGFDVGIPYYEDWKSRANAVIDDRIIEVEANRTHWDSLLQPGIQSELEHEVFFSWRLKPKEIIWLKEPTFQASYPCFLALLHMC